ncbi:MAG TPA: hypothetical protein DDZ90_09750, partial [Planctomycetaceae bacterium]|nr:hypothetical protein [Planctomycetaceae bacterium]
FNSTSTIENRIFHESIPLHFTAEQSEATFDWTRAPEEGLRQITRVRTALNNSASVCPITAAGYSEKRIKEF